MFVCQSFPASCIPSILFAQCQALCSGYIKDPKISSSLLHIIRCAREPVAVSQSVQGLVYLPDCRTFI